MRCWLLAFGILCSFGATAQQKTISGSTIEQVIERLFSIQEEDLDRELLAEVFFELYQNPIDLNQASTEELLATYLLSPSQVQAIQAYKLENGRLLSLYELQAIPGFDLATIELLLPFLRTEEEVKKNQTFFN
ncbi:MAG: helix-hairpin-helix domain-containing protein [Bacteroidetes bacterium]|nr:helix-hairpin-helix domain-containing protein [Bacteroidota bacterium]